MTQAVYVFALHLKNKGIAAEVIGRFSRTVVIGRMRVGLARMKAIEKELQQEKPFQIQSSNLEGFFDAGDPMRPAYVTINANNHW